MFRLALLLMLIPICSAHRQELNASDLTEKEHRECGERWGIPGAISDYVRQREKVYGLELEQLYNRVLTISPNQAIVREAQRSWLKYQGATCKFHEQYWLREGTGIARSLAARCLLLTTLQRIRELYPVIECTWDGNQNRVSCDASAIRGSKFGTSTQSRERGFVPATFLGSWCLVTNRDRDRLLYQPTKSHERCHTSWLEIRSDGYDGQDGNSGPSMACTAIANASTLSNRYTIRSRCHGEGSNWQEKITMYLANGLLMIEQWERDQSQ